MSVRLFLACALVLLGCEAVLSAQTLKLVPLPADVQTGPALAGVQTKEGRIFAAPVTGGLLRLSADGGTWDVLPAPTMQRFLPDFKEGLSLAEGADQSGIFRAAGDAFVAFDPPVPVLGDPSFSNAGWSALLGRDAKGVFWASVVPTFGVRPSQVFLAHLEPAASDWKYDEGNLPAVRPTMTSDARFFFRPHLGGLSELDPVTHSWVERVSCDHELFRPSRPDFAQCQEDTFLFAGRSGELFLLNPNRELWRIDGGDTLPARVVKADLPRLEVGAGQSSQGAPQVYLDPKGRVWLSFRWGTNTESDTSFLYVAEPAKHDSWTFLKSDLPPAVLLFGDGATPLISSSAQNTGLLLFRITE